MKLTGKIELGNLIALLRKHLGRSKPLLLMVPDALLLIVLLVLLLTAGTSQQDSDEFYQQAEQTMRQVSATVQEFRRALRDSELQELAVNAVVDQASLPGLPQHISDHLPGFIGVDLYGIELNLLRFGEMGPFSFALFDMLLAASETGISPLQIHGEGNDAYLAMAVQIGNAESPQAYLLVKLEPALLTRVFHASLPTAGVYALYQHNGLFMPTRIAEFVVEPTTSEWVSWLLIPGSFLRAGVTQLFGFQV